MAQSYTGPIFSGQPDWARVPIARLESFHWEKESPYRVNQGGAAHTLANNPDRLVPYHSEICFFYPDFSLSSCPSGF